MAVTFSAQVDRFDSDLWHFHISVPEEAAAPFLEGKDRRVICLLEGKERFHCALMADGKGGWFINLNEKRRKKLGLVQGQVVTAELEKDTSEYGLPMPEELREMMDQDEDGNRYFHGLTPGKQRSLIYWTSNVKSSHIRIRRALVLMNHLKSQQGKIDFKLLNQELKAANQQGL